MIDVSEIKLNDFEFWKVDLKKVLKNETTGQISKIVTKLNWFTPIGFTKNCSLIVFDIKGKKQWIKHEYWDSSSSPYWKVNDDYAIVVRLKIDIPNDIQLLAIMAEIKKNDLSTNN